MRNNQKLLAEKNDLYQQFLKEKDKSSEQSKLESQLAILTKENQVLSSNIDKLHEREHRLKEELSLVKLAANEATTVTAAAQHQEIISGLFSKKNEELQLSQQINDLKLDIRDKEFQLKEREREHQFKEKELEKELERLKQQVKTKEEEVGRAWHEKEQEMKSMKERGLMNKRYMDNVQKEQRIMGSVFHKMAFELF